MNHIFKVDKSLQNVLLVGVDGSVAPGDIPDITAILKLKLVPKFFNDVIVIRGLEGAYYITKC